MNKKTFRILGLLALVIGLLKKNIILQLIAVVLLWHYVNMND